MPSGCRKREAIPVIAGAAIQKTKKIQPSGPEILKPISEGLNEMNRREFLGTGLAAGVYSTRSEIISPLLFGAEAPAASETATGSGPAWLNDGPIIMAGCWDDFPLFQKRTGGTSTWLNDLYRKQGSNANVDALKEAGVTLGMIHFFKGFGLNAEHDHIEDARVLARKLKANGIRVGLYVGSTIAYETFLLEKPDAQSWFLSDYLGKPLYYGDQTFRRRVYFMHPGYRDYIKSVVRYGMENLDPDLIHFDNTSMQAQPAAFSHPMAVEDFRKFLTANFSAGELHDRLGFSDVRYVEAPQLQEFPVHINDPLLQLWTDFRCHQLTAYYAEMASLIRSINPAVAVENNPSTGISGRNVIWEQGVDYPRLLGAIDVAWTEEGDNATVTPDGALISKIRTLKAASILKKKIFCYTWGAEGNWGYRPNIGGLLQMAESMTYNRQCLGMVGIFDAVADLPAEPRRYIQFYRQNFDLYRNVESVADVALLYSFASMGFNSERPNISFMLASQMLIQEPFLFDIIFDQHLNDLSKYRVLFLADQESLSDAQIGQIQSFVRKGGGLVATGHSSLYTERRERRPDFGLKDCFGISAPAWVGSDVDEPDVPGDPVQNHFGHGKVTYVAAIIPTTMKPSHQGPGRKQHYWNLAANNDQLRSGVLAALNGAPSVRLTNLRSPYVTLELLHQPAASRLVLHLLNYDHVRTPEMQDVAVELTLPSSRRVKGVRGLSPDAPGANRSLDWKGDGTISFQVPSLKIYSVVVIDLA